MADKSSLLFFLLFSLHLILIAASVNVHGADLEEENVWAVKKEDRKSIVSTEDGEISSAWITRGCRSYHLQFITLEPNSLFLPVLLHEDMVFYVHTGSGRLSWTDEDHSKYVDLRRGDVYRMPQGTVFFLQSSLETERPKLRIHAIFVGSDDDFSEQATRVYSSIRDMVLGFDKKVLQAAFKVPEEVIEKILNGTKPPAIVHGVPRTKRTAWEMEAQFMRGLIGTRGYNIFELNKKKQKTTKLFNIFSEDKDFENCNGWSTTVTRKRLSALKGSDVSIFMVNLTSGSMMGPHWNPRATEIAVVLQGQGMIRVVCSGISNETDCRNTRLKVEEGDVFAIPRFHPMAQMAFNNDTFVFMGFSTSTKKNYPQFLAGKASVLQTLDKGVLSVSFNIENTTVDRLLAPQHDSVILGCTSCAEEELRMMEEEMEKEKEAERKREEEEARKKAEEKRREEEEARKREEEEARKEEEERRKREEEEEEAKRREEEEAKRKAEEEEAKRREREQEEARKREEEEEAKRREREQEEARKRGEEEARKREEEEARKEEEERRKREEEEAEAKRREEEEEEAKRREREQEEARQREQEEARRRQEEEEEAKKREQEQAEKEEEEEEAQRREEEEARKRQEETRKRQEEAEAQREEEEARKRQEEEEAQRREEEEAKRRQEEQEGQQPGRSEEEQAAERERKQQEEAQREEEAARQQEKEMERQQQQEGGGKGEGQQVHMDEE